MNSLLRHLLYFLVIWPLVTIILGFNIRRKSLLPTKGPCILVSNHNSHLDTVVLMTLFPIKLLNRIRPVAAADYFLRNPFVTWFSTKIVGIIPIKRSIRSVTEGHPLDPIVDALESEDIVVIFPEGTRGEPEELSKFKTGIAHLAKRFPDVPVTPIYMHGLGKSLPRGEALLVPFFIDIFVGDAIKWTGDKNNFMETLSNSMAELSEECNAPEWV